MDKNLIIRSVVTQVSILWSIIFLMYINDLSGNLEANVKLFTDDTSMFWLLETLPILHES